MRPQARPFLEPSDLASPVQALGVLDRELNAPRRFAAGAAAVVLLVLAGLAASLAADLIRTEDAAVAALCLGIIALTLTGAATWIGLGVIAAGRHVVGAYRLWSDADTGAGTRPRALIERAFAGPWLAREALAAAAFLAAAFAVVLLILPLTGTLEDFVAGGVLIGGSGLIAFGTATWCLLATDLRAGRAHSRRIARGYQRSRGR